MARYYAIEAHVLVRTGSAIGGEGDLAGEDRLMETAEGQRSSRLRRGKIEWLQRNGSLKAYGPAVSDLRSR